MYILVAGDNEVAFNIAELLMEKHKVVLITPDLLDVPRLDRLDVDRVRGEPTSTAVLREAKIDACGVFVAASDHDEGNLVACIAAQNMGARRTICLLSRPGFVTISERDDELASSLGIDAVVRPADQLAQEILRIVTVPGALDVEHFVHGRVRLLRTVVEPDAPLTEYPLRQTALPKGVVMAMGRRGEERFIPNGDTHFRAGDKLTLMGTPRAVNDVMYRFVRSRHHGKDKQEATIIGGGVVGLAVARGLESAGWEIKVIECCRDRAELISSQLDGLVLHGDGSDLDLLEEEEVGDAPVLIAVTSNDEKNLLVSLLARTLGVQRIITRADHLSNERLFERVGIDVCRSARGAAIRKVVRDVIDAQSGIRAELEHGDFAVVELELDAGYPPTPLVDLRTPLFTIVGAVLREREVIIPNGQTEVRGGDRLLIVAASEDISAARAHFCHMATEEVPKATI